MSAHRKPIERKGTVVPMRLYMPEDVKARLFAIADATERPAGELVAHLLNHGGFEKLEQLPSAYAMVERAIANRVAA